MTDNNLITVKVGDTVKHKHRNHYFSGKIIKLLDGCNAVCWVDFGETVNSKPHLTICTQYDIIKI